MFIREPVRPADDSAGLLVAQKGIARGIGFRQALGGEDYLAVVRVFGIGNPIDTRTVDLAETLAYDRINGYLVKATQRIFLYTGIKRFDCVVVHGEINARGPVEATGPGQDPRIGGDFYAFVLNVTGVDDLPVVAAKRVHGQGDDLVRRIGLVPGEIDAQDVVEEPHFGTQFEGFDQLTFDVGIVQDDTRGGCGRLGRRIVVWIEA